MPNRKHSTEPDIDEDEQDSILHLPTSGNSQFPCSIWGIDVSTPLLIVLTNTKLDCHSSLVAN